MVLTRLWFPEFFARRGVAAMTLRELFDFITDPAVSSANMEAYLDKVSSTWPYLRTRPEPESALVPVGSGTPPDSRLSVIGGAGHGDGGPAHGGAAIGPGPGRRGGNGSEAPPSSSIGSQSSLRLRPPQVFKQAYIPRTLTQVRGYERHVELMRSEEAAAISGHHDDVRAATFRLLLWFLTVLMMMMMMMKAPCSPQVLYQTLTGLKKDLSGVQTVGTGSGSGTGSSPGSC